MPLNHRQIEAFHAVMTAGSISGAAKLLFVSQPAVSRLLANTERRAGFLLFERVRGRLYPTPEARQLFDAVDNAYVSLRRVNELARDLAEHRRGVLTVVSHATAGRQLVPHAISAFHARFPDARLCYECLRHAFLQERLLNAQADLAITLFPVEHPSIESLPLCETTLVCVLPAGHPLGRHETLTPAQLREHAVIAYERGSPFGVVYGEVFGRADAPDASIEAGNPEDACALAQCGAGIALVDRFTALVAATGTVRVLADAPTLTMRVLHRRYGPLSTAARAFVDVLRQSVRERDFGQLPFPRRRMIRAA
jgi:DNA-binding transcriptional LysR family regulator